MAQPRPSFVSRSMFPSLRLHLRFPTVVMLAVCLTGALRGDTNQALVELLKSLTLNGALTREQSEAILRLAGSGNATGAPSAAGRLSPTDAGAESVPPPVFATPREKGITRLVISGLVHSQWDWLATDVSNGPELASRSSFLMRRLKLAVAGEVTPEWRALIQADFAATNPLEEAFVSYRGFAGSEITFGHTKVPFLKEELLSDYAFKGVDRSITHRAFVEQAGRGFGSKNTGLQLKHKWSNGLNATVSAVNPGARNFAGTAGSVANGLAYYSELGFEASMASGRIEYAIQGGYLPDLLATGPITAAAGHVYYEGRHLTFLSEYVTGWYANRLGAARQTGVMVEPAFKFTPEWEMVLRYAAVDSNGLGVAPGTLIRGAAATGNFDQVDSVYVGGNYYFVGNAVRLTFGYEYAKATGALTGTANENVIRGFRSRFQFLY